MNLLALIPMRWVIILGGILASLGIVYFSYEHWVKAEQAIGAAPYIAAIEKQKIEAAATLKVLTEQVQAREKALDDFTNARNENDQVNESAISVLADKLHAAGRLRDPRATGGSGPASGTQVAAGSGTGAEDATATSGLLSVEASDFLRGQAQLADEINAAYISCRADAYEVRK